MIEKIGMKENLLEGLKKAAEIIRSGGIVAFPTESFYGLGVNATDEKAIKRLFGIKKRQEDHPVLILIPAIETLEEYVADIPETALTIMKRFWPGGLTLVFAASAMVSPLLTSGTGKIGVRLSGHPVATALARAVGLPITGTSANISGQPACQTAEAVSQSLGSEIDLILDGGKTSGIKGSTILDITVSPPTILREGMIGREELIEFLQIPLSGS
ncbi:MAG: L-threonylcarbamoyladenylate synthase [Pseudomonadota bacterium]